MLKRVIEWSVRNKVLVLILGLITAGAGILAMIRTPLEAIPDLSDVQVIIQTDYQGQAPQLVEDQVTYPIASEMLKVPGAQTVRGYSFFGVSFVYIIFEDGTDIYWARSRVLEYLSGIQSRLPEGAEMALGPDATGLGWVYQYVLEDNSGTHSLADLRSIQDWFLRYQLTSVPGVSEVASVGGFERAYEVTLDPDRLRGFGVSVHQVMEAIRSANQDVGAMVLEMADREYMVRGLGYIEGLGDIESVVLAASETGAPIRIADVANVQLAPEVRRGVADLDGRGDVVGGIVVMRFGENALATIGLVKEKIAEIQAGLPEGVTLKPVYDRSELILRAIDTLREKLIEESIVVALVCLVFLFHVRSALVVILTLPLGILMAFIAMRFLGINADIMSLGGIAIAIGAMVDAAIVMIENMHKHLEREIGEKCRRAGPGDPGFGIPEGRFPTSLLSSGERWSIVLRASKEVGPALFFSLLIITVSFLPVFALEAQEGRLFKPLAWTKTLAMGGASLLALTMVPVTMGLFVRGTLTAEEKNPVYRFLVWVYKPVLEFALRWRWPVLGVTLAVVILSMIPLQRIGSEFMPPLNEGSMMYMPMTLPGISVRTAHEAMRKQDSILATFPEVESVFGKAGRANTATDPAPLAMFETTIVLKPEEDWREGLTWDGLIQEMDEAIRFPGIPNSWTMPIKGRIDMLATGIRTPVGIKIFGPDLAELGRLGREVENAVAMVPGTRSAVSERPLGGRYLNIKLDRGAAARYGVNVRDANMVIASAVGGMEITQTVEGRERYGVRVRYPQELRDRPERISEILVPVRQTAGTGVGNGMPSAMDPGGATQIPLGQIATIEIADGPMSIKTEGAFPTVWVFVDVDSDDIGGYVRAAQDMVDAMVTLPPGYTLEWSGQHEFMERARARLALVVPATLLLIFILLFLNFGRVGETLIVMGSLPFALVGGILIMFFLGYNWSVATGVGFIALAGVAAETAVIMLLYLNHAWDDRIRRGRISLEGLHDAVMEGAVMRVRPKVMTVTTIIVGLLPILWGSGTGASVMKRIAAPMVGGMVSATVLTLVVVPVIYFIWQGAQVERGRVGNLTGIEID
ncbi:MAG: efflux RND transporter permease subunit [Gemmatimonadetes bacterium]|nr:CusA/CzcA family heavy metal efflux RND transporter [Gemmatimonadota bacterium]NNM06836.1 efflux RND transporter permease subunit [Gemmatimonadota bacterium]